MKKKIAAFVAAGAIVGTALLASTAPVFGHGMGAGRQAIDPEAPSCVGQLTSMHAKRFKGIAHTNHVDTSDLPQGPKLKTFETVQDFMHGIQEYCEAE